MSQEDKEKESHEPILSPAGEPFRTETAAANAMAQMGLGGKTHAVKKHMNGFAIFEQPKEPKAKRTSDEKYFWVKFQDRSSKNDEVDVTLRVNGETLTITRNQKVPLPARYLECADHATYQLFEQLPNQPRKYTRNIRVFPYDNLGECSKEDFENWKRDGTKKTMETIKRHGFDFDPDRIGTD